LALIGVVWLAAACGGDGSEGSSAAEDDSPLNELFGGNETSAESRAKQLEAEDLVAECMSEAGWEYTPVDYTAQFGDEIGAEDADLSMSEYGEKYAYGVVRSYELYELPSLLGQDDPEGPIDEGFVDPNNDYVMSLAPEEQELYYRDLYGDPGGFAEPIEGGDGSEETVFTMPPLEEQGCQGRAQAEVYGDSVFSDPDMQTRMDELFEDMENDSAVKSAQRAWSECMTDSNADWTFPTSNDVYQYFERRKAEMAGQELVETTFDTTTGEPLDDSIDTSNSWGSSYDATGEGYIILGQPEPISETNIEALRAEEKTVWEADQKCQKKSDLLDARRAAEQKMVDVMKQEFPQLAETDAGEG
jgi:hypothetical protein